VGGLREEGRRYAIGRGCDSFDFTIGDEDHKRNWSDRLLALKDHHIWGGALATFPATCVLTVKRIAKNSPRCWQVTVRSRALLGRLGSRFN
jgi:CelD/BcsL family acetyltransferase involved in cellulose biosynthesis